MSKKINPEAFYTPIEIAKMDGVLTATSPNTRRQMLLRHIREKRVEAKNLGGDGKPRYVIQGKHLIEYIKENMEPESYTKK
jgi:hypothetical protein